MIKRLFDIVISLSLLIVLFPLILIISLAITLWDGSPVFFRQRRLGKGGKEFFIHKFRTMRNPIPNKYETEAERITPLGRILRKFSLDELPLLLNVIAGSMSLVGPRPLLAKYKPRYNSFQNRRHEVLPGITGLAQIKGRNRLSWEQKFQYDVYYVDHQSFFLDLKILAVTVFQVLMAKNISPDEQEIMPEFLGSDEENETVK
ncbi:MAG: sugar transferase [Candidatus Zixiibacteriota bacterium]